MAYGLQKITYICCLLFYPPLDFLAKKPQTIVCTKTAFSTFLMRDDSKHLGQSDKPDGEQLIVPCED